MIISKVGRRGQITLPLAVRNQLNLKEGEHIAFVQKDELPSLNGIHGLNVRSALRRYPL